MKKVMKSFMAMALGLSLVLAGCSKDDDSKLAEFTGTYPVEINVRLAEDPVISGLEVDLILTEENGNFKASANLADYGNINIVLSSLSSNLPDLGSDVEVTDLRGYVFKVAEQQITLAASPVPVKIKGYVKEGSNGYNGAIVKGKVFGIELTQISIFLEGVDLPLYIEIVSRFGE
jgi:hypothetical protein